MRLGLLGGSFDPVHYGHLLLAETCREHCRLDEVWFLPAATPPHKHKVVLTPGKTRVEMLELAIAGNPALRVSTLEIERGGLSYTVETLRALHAERPDDELFWLMGADTLHDLPQWREPSEILRLATPIVVQRHGSPSPDFAVLRPLVDDARLATFAQYVVPMPIVELSSTDLRARVQQARSIRYRTPRAVEQYILSHQLYT